MDVRVLCDCAVYMNFKITEQTLKIYAQELVMWGQSKKLEPAELAIILGLISKMLSDIMGIEEK